MHEYHLVEAVVKQALESAHNAKATKVIKVTFVIGELSAVKKEPVEMYFKELSGGTILEHAELEFKEAPIKLHCKSCNTFFEKRKNEFNCPNCCALGFLTNSGKEFYIENLEIEIPD